MDGEKRGLPDWFPDRNGTINCHCSYSAVVGDAFTWFSIPFSPNSCCCCIIHNNSTFCGWTLHVIPLSIAIPGKWRTGLIHGEWILCCFHISPTLTLLCWCKCHTSHHHETANDWLPLSNWLHRDGQVTWWDGAGSCFAPYQINASLSYIAMFSGWHNMLY